MPRLIFVRANNWNNAFTGQQAMDSSDYIIAHSIYGRVFCRSDLHCQSSSHACQISESSVLGRTKAERFGNARCSSVLKLIANENRCAAFEKL